jgi:hypothetical protein
MALDTKPNLNDNKFEQQQGETLHLSGNTYIHDYGEFRIQSGATFVIESSPDVNKVLVSNATGCGNWGNIPVYNGLSVCNLGRAALGGTLSGNTEIEICSYKFQVSGVENLIALTGDSAMVYASGATLYLKDGCASLLSDIGDCLHMSLAATTFTSVSGGGIKYADNYSSNYTSRSLVDAAYVTGLTVNMITGATNGLTVANRRVCLGGTLSTPTSICIPTPNTLSFFNTESGSGIAISPGFAGVCACGAMLSLGKCAYVCSCYGDSLCMCTGSTVFISGTGGGIKYNADYSNNYTLRSLVDKAYVTGLTSSISTLIASGERITKCINKTSHGFNVKDVIGWSGGTYNKAIADGTYDGEVVGIVSKCYNANYFDLTQVGYVTGLTGLAINTTYFLSDVTAGLLTATEPTTVDHISKAVLIANSTTTGWVLPYPGYIITSGVTPSVAWGDISGSIADQTDLQIVLLKSVTGATNLGAGDGALYTSVSDQLIQLKRLSGGTNVTITCNDNYIAINAASDGGTITGATNGLSVSDKDIVLGGNLINDTVVSGGSQIKSVGFCNLGGFVVCNTHVDEGYDGTDIILKAGNSIDSGMPYQQAGHICIIAGSVVPTAGHFPGYVCLSSPVLYLDSNNTVSHVRIQSSQSTCPDLELSVKAVGDGSLVKIGFEDSSGGGWSCFDCYGNITMLSCRIGVICGGCCSDNHGNSLLLQGGLAGGTNCNGGNLILSGGIPNGSGSYGRVQIINLPAKSGETNVIYINSNGYLSSGSTSGDGSAFSVHTITGNSSSTGFSVTHGCNQQFVMVQVVQAASPYATVYTDVTRTNANCVCITFDTAPPTGTCYKILITG